MHDILISARFEWRYHLRQPMFYGLLALALAQGAATATTTYSQLADVQLQLYAPALFYLAFAGMGPLLVASIALLTGQALLRDRDCLVGTYLYAAPIQSRAYFSGQFLGLLAVCGALAGAYALGLLTLPLWVRTPVADAVSTFPTPAYLDGFFRLLLPNVLLVVCLSFALTALLRHIAGAYVAMLLLVLGSTLLQLGYASVVEFDWAHLLDPFAAISIRQALEEMSVSEKNTTLFVMPVLSLINRLLWLGLSGWLLTRADQRLSFPYWLEQGPVFGVWAQLKERVSFRKQPTEPTGLRQNLAAGFGQRWYERLPARTLRVQLYTLFRLAWSDARWLVRQPAVAVALLLIGLGMVGYANGIGDAPGGQRLLPFTSRMTFVRLPLHLYISLFLIVFTGELVHRERTTRLWLLTDATPMPTWMMLLGKAGAMLLMAAGLTTTLFLTGLYIQLADGQTPIDWALYANDLLADGLLRYAQVIALTLLVQATVTNRFVGHVAVLTGLGVLAYADAQTGGLATYLYTHVPGSGSYSEITGYGSVASLRPVLMGLWTLVAVGLVLLATRLAQRGAFVGPGVLLRRFRAQLSPTYLAAWGLLGLAGLGGSVWLLRTEQPQVAGLITPYNTTTEQVEVAGRRVNVQYHFVHGQNREAIQAAVRRALQRGSAWLGECPQNILHITETPFSALPAPVREGQVRIAERDGWMTDRSRTFDEGLLDMAVTTQVLNQWLGVRFATNKQAGLLTDGLATYLALRIVQEQRGDDWLRTQLAHLTTQYRRGLSQTAGTEPTVAQAAAGTFVAQTKAPVSLTSIGEVWGHEPLCRQIGQFYREQRTRQPATSASYVAALNHALPDSLRYTTTYLTERPRFDFALGALGQYDDRIGVKIYAHKFLNDGAGTLREEALKDYVPIALLDGAGKVIHRQLVRTYTAGLDDKTFWLPRPANAATIALDPLGAWPESNRINNRKALARLWSSNL